jgi:hypothetical protein
LILFDIFLVNFFLKNDSSKKRDVYLFVDRESIHLLGSAIGKKFNTYF